MSKIFSWFASTRTIGFLHYRFCKRITVACCTARTCASSLQSIIHYQCQPDPKGLGQEVGLTPANRVPSAGTDTGSRSKGLACLQTHIPHGPNLQVADQWRQLLWYKLDLFSLSHTNTSHRWTKSSWKLLFMRRSLTQMIHRTNGN